MGKREIKWLKGKKGNSEIKLLKVKKGNTIARMEKGKQNCSNGKRDTNKLKRERDIKWEKGK